MAVTDEQKALVARGHEIARAFHETYEALAPKFGYETRRASAVPWESVPDQNKDLMVAVAIELMREHKIVHPDIPAKVVKAWQRLAKCEDEFESYGLATQACGEYADHLDAAILELANTTGTFEEIERGVRDAMKPTITPTGEWLRDQRTKRPGQ